MTTLTLKQPRMRKAIPLDMATKTPAVIPTPTQPAKKPLRALVGTVVGMFPDIFNQERPVPLAIGIAKPLRDRAGLSWSETRRLLHWWCGRSAYHIAVMTAEHRVDLDGSQTEIAPREREHAREQLASNSVATTQNKRTGESHGR